MPDSSGQRRTLQAWRDRAVGLRRLQVARPPHHPPKIPPPPGRIPTRPRRTRRPASGGDRSAGLGEMTQLTSRSVRSIKPRTDPVSAAHLRRRIHRHHEASRLSLAARGNSREGACLRLCVRDFVVETRSYFVQYCFVSTPRPERKSAAHVRAGLPPRAANPRCRAKSA